MLAALVVALSALLAPTGALRYAVQHNFSGPGFFDAFDFWTQYDPTFGFVEYVDRETALSLDMLNVTDGVAYFGAESAQIYDPYANKGRKSLRLSTKQKFNHGLFVVDVVRMPNSVCGIWPAIWMLGNGPLPWPAYGEIDIAEFTNDARHNLFTLHTTPNCTIAGSGQTGRLLTSDCGEDLGFKGCMVSPDMPNSAGTDFNAHGGGVFAVEWTSEPDTDTLGTPVANFQGGCNIDSHFSNMQVIFNIDFCGTWAGSTFNTNNSCPISDPNPWTSCNIYVGRNPQAYKEAYFAVNSLVIYQVSTPASSSVTFSTPTESTASALVGSSEIRSTTSSSPIPARPSAASSVISIVVSTLTSADPSRTSTIVQGLPTPAVTTEVIVLTSVITRIVTPSVAKPMDGVA